MIPSVTVSLWGRKRIRKAMEFQDWEKTHLSHSPDTRINSLCVCFLLLSLKENHFDYAYSFACRFRRKEYRKGRLAWDRIEGSTMMLGSWKAKIDDRHARATEYVQGKGLPFIVEMIYIVLCIQAYKRGIYTLPAFPIRSHLLPLKNPRVGGFNPSCQGRIHSFQSPERHIPHPAPHPSGPYHIF